MEVLSKMKPEVIQLWKGMVRQGQEEHKLLGFSIPRQTGMLFLMSIYME